MVEFDIKRSKKSYLEGDEKYIITWGGVVYLRILGCEGKYTLMTATAGDDYGKDVACPNMDILIEAALRTCSSFNLRPIMKRDCHDKKYVKLGECEYISDAFRVAERLFQIFQECSSSRTGSELVEV